MSASNVQSRTQSILRNNRLTSISAESSPSLRIRHVQRAFRHSQWLNGALLDNIRGKMDMDLDSKASLSI